MVISQIHIICGHIVNCKFNYKSKNRNVSIRTHQNRSFFFFLIFKHIYQEFKILIPLLRKKNYDLKNSKCKYLISF